MSRGNDTALLTQTSGHHQVSSSGRSVLQKSLKEAMEGMDLPEGYDYHQDYNYSYETSIPREEPVFQHKSMCMKEVLCVFLLVVSVVIFLLGFCGNGLVMWISGFKMKKTVNTTWYMSLAISDFVFCAFLPFSIANMAMEKWIFGRFMCKFASSVMFLNMFSSIFLLVVISIDRCVSVMFPVWAQNHRTVKKASVIVFICWLLAIGMSFPSVIFREVSTHMGRTICYNNYTSYQHGHKVVAVSRFLAGFVVPFVVIIVCYSIIILKLRSNRMMKSSKPFKVMSALVAAFFICWLPYHVSVLLELDHQRYNHNILVTGLKVGTLMAAANSFLNPVLYVFMGNDFKQKFKISVLSKMENAMAEEGRTTSRYLSRSSSMDGRASTHI
ncbi:chemokine-like receptor 1 [Anarrhichthys ocellatus]|uniref:chemokine-like receptor 1 n=1 Tax=Anarrhichthys ocellatus TaxID=433405 RepID=UPI0012ED36F1|nr:chemokine-like receptor 1 [Anarrhichthys ocellatus]